LSPQWSLSLWFPHQHLMHTSPFLHTCHMPSPSHSSSQLHDMYRRISSYYFTMWHDVGNRSGSRNVAVLKGLGSLIILKNIKGKLQYAASSLVWVM
jgi:hypothetical protein